MPIKKSDDIENEGSDFANQKSTSKLENINERFDDTTHNDNPYDDAIQYIKKKVDEIVDETNIQTIASGSYAGDIKTLKKALGEGLTNNAGALVISTNDDGALVFTVGKSSWTISG
jgi:hypothetical protein